MTKTQAVNKLLVWAAAQVGYHEGANNYNKFAEGQDGVYGWHIQNQPWCDIFVDVGFVECFGLQAAARMTYQPAGGFSAGCSASADYYRKRGAFVRSPEPGDQIFFYVSGGINHTGIVTRVYGGSIVTIEGNSSDMVAERVYQIGASNIAGYGRPDWSVIADVDPGEADEAAPAEPEVETCEVTIPVLKLDSTGAAVAALQAALKHIGYDPVWIDGEFGERTYEALKLFQSEYGLEDELGICGKETWATIMRI